MTRLTAIAAAAEAGVYSISFTAVTDIFYAHVNTPRLF